MMIRVVAAYRFWDAIGANVSARVVEIGASLSVVLSVQHACSLDSEAVELLDVG
jgi:hypothetical protein